ncbi:unnamed protein product [Caenorhabditis nigoni]
MRDEIQQAHQCQNVVYRRGVHQYSRTTLAARVQEKRKEVESGQKPLNVRIIAAHLAKTKQKGKAGIPSGNVSRTASSMSSSGNGPQIQDESTRSSMLIGSPSGNKALSSSNPNPSEAAATGNQVTPSSCRAYTTRQATNGSHSALNNAAQKPQAPAPCFNPTQTVANFGRNVGENVSMNIPGYPTDSTGERLVAWYRWMNIFILNMGSPFFVPMLHSWDATIDGTVSTAPACSRKRWCA